MTASLSHRYTSKSTLLADFPQQFARRNLSPHVKDFFPFYSVLRLQGSKDSRLNRKYSKSHVFCLPYCKWWWQDRWGFGCARRWPAHWPAPKENGGHDRWSVPPWRQNKRWAERSRLTGAPGGGSRPWRLSNRKYWPVIQECHLTGSASAGDFFTWASMSLSVMTGVLAPDEPEVGDLGDCAGVESLVWFLLLLLLFWCLWWWRLLWQCLWQQQPLEEVREGEVTGWWCWWWLETWKHCRVCNVSCIYMLTQST